MSEQRRLVNVLDAPDADEQLTQADFLMLCEILVNLNRDPQPG